MKYLFRHLDAVQAHKLITPEMLAKNAFVIAEPEKNGNYTVHFQLSVPPEMIHEGESIVGRDWVEYDPRAYYNPESLYLLKDDNDDMLVAHVDPLTGDLDHTAVGDFEPKYVRWCGNKS